ncbi:CNH-domain-containing protein [Meira miltonrushii]|uniref:CNH-domain-containing protein n=1 Tax=Meira miltonrushii TaxID=1280837 RepID=A0A316VND1_9BASI|nr:CNH-domain-containing protein [Meira miltonrushii]PWN37923.1 CNH-domain-containing protein [Meira miltonrushii]
MPLPSNGNGDGYNPDKRTTAYENIFGRPTAKPKGPAAYPVPGMAAAPPPNPNTYNWVNQQAYGSNQQPSRYNGGMQAAPNGFGNGAAGGSMYGYPSQSQVDMIDRRASATPSAGSDPRSSQYYTGAGSAAEAYGNASGSVAPPVGGPSSGMYNPSYFQRTPSSSMPPQQANGPYYPDSLPYRHPSSNVGVPPSQYQRPGSIGSVPPEASPPGVHVPRLPSFDLGSAAPSSEEHWFQHNGAQTSSNGTAVPSTFAHSTATGTTYADETAKSPTGQSVALMSDGGANGEDLRDDGYDFREYQNQAIAKSTASSIRRGSFESDRQSIANSMFTLPGATSRMQISGGYFHPSAAMQDPSNAATWGKQSRMRTTSSATTQGLMYGDSQNGEWRKSGEPAGGPASGSGAGARSMSFGQNSLKPGSALVHSNSGQAPTTPPVPSAHRRGPIVYPALLSRVADAFKQRVAVAERTKDGLTYTDAFDGREAVDKIAYIIKTSDRNLALLLGRALDAQKFFHDVTYDHRLRDSPNELYQFRVRLTSPFGSDGDAYQEDGFRTPPTQLEVPSTGPTRDNSLSTLQDGSKLLEPPESTPLAEDDEDALPTGVFTLLTDCYSPTCTRDRLCYSIACPRRLEQQARLNMKPQPGLKRSISKESLGDAKEPGALWAESVSAEVLNSVSDSERKRQELINEAISTERDFVRDLEYLRDSWIKPLRSRDIIAEARREDFVTQVFWNVLEIHAVNSKLAEMLTKRQKQQAVVDRIGDILLEMSPHFQPFVKYGAHQLYGKYEFEKEKSSNPAFAKFVDEVERMPESRKLELNGYLTKPTTRLARYPLLLEAVNKATPDDNPDKQALPKVIKIVKEFLTKVNAESGKSENRFNLAQLDQQLVFKQGEAVDLRLRDEQRELVFKGPLKRRGGSQSDSAELQVFLFDHALLMVKAKTVHKNDLYKVFRKPIPLELLIVTVYDEVPTGKGNSTRPKSVMSKTSTGNRLSGPVPTGTAPKQDQKTGYALTFTYLGRKGYSQTLWASTFVSRMKWFEHIENRQEILRQRSNIFDTITLSENFFIGPARVTCSVPFDFGRRIIYGADDGVYLSDLRERARPPTKVLPLPGVTQVDVLEEYQILIILAEKSVHTFTLDALDPSDPMGSLKRGRRISSHTSFFKAGQCLGRTLVCVVKSSSLSSTIKTLEPIEPNLRIGKKQQTFRKLLQGGQESLRVFKEFYIPTESSSIHFLKTKLCVGCTKGFEIVDLETLDTQGLLDPADSNLDFVQKRENVKPIAIYRIDGDFLLCYDEFAFYVNKNGWRAKGNWIIHWEGNPTSFALHHPYVLAFEPSFVEVRHVQTGALHQVITGYNLRCLFADVPPPASAAQSSASSSASSIHSHTGIGSMSPFGRPAPPPMHYAIGAPPYNPALSRQQSFNMMGQGAYPPNPYGPAGARPPPPGHGPAGMGPGGPYVPPGAPMPPPHMAPFGQRPPPPGVPYGFGQAQPSRQASIQRNPVWESVAASRNQIVFIGDTTVFCVRPAVQGQAANSSSTSTTTANGNNPSPPK